MKVAFLTRANELQRRARAERRGHCARDRSPPSPSRSCPCSPPPGRCRRGPAGRSSSSGTACAPSSRPPATRCSSPAASATTSPPATPSWPGSARSPEAGPSCSTGRSWCSTSAGRPNFGLLQDRMHVRHPSAELRARLPVSFYAFDVLHLDGESLLAASYDERRARLADARPGGAGARAAVVHRRRRRPDARSRRRARARGRRRQAPRRRATSPGSRSPGWVKTALVRTQEVLVGGLDGGGGAAHRDVRLAAARRARRRRQRCAISATSAPGSPTPC